MSGGGGGESKDFDDVAYLQECITCFKALAKDPKSSEALANVENLKRVPEWLAFRAEAMIKSRFPFNKHLGLLNRIFRKGVYQILEGLVRDDLLSMCRGEEFYTGGDIVFLVTTLRAMVLHDTSHVEKNAKEWARNESSTTYHDGEMAVRRALETGNDPDAAIIGVRAKNLHLSVYDSGNQTLNYLKEKWFKEFRFRPVYDRVWNGEVSRRILGRCYEATLSRKPYVTCVEDGERKVFHSPIIKMTLIRDHLWSAVQHRNVDMVGLLMNCPELGIHGTNSSLLQACAINRHDLVDAISLPRANYEVWHPKSISMDECESFELKLGKLYDDIEQQEELINDIDEALYVMEKSGEENIEKRTETEETKLKNAKKNLKSLELQKLGVINQFELFVKDNDSYVKESLSVDVNTRIDSLCIGKLGIMGRDIQEGDTPLIICGKNRSATIIKLLLRRGAAVDLVDRDGRTALMHACRQHSVHSVKILLEAGADPNIGESRLVKPSLENPMRGLIHDSVHGVRNDPNTIHTGFTPLMCVVQRYIHGRSHVEDDTIIKLLLVSGADPNLQVPARRVDEREPRKFITPLTFVCHEATDASVLNYPDWRLKYFRLIKMILKYSMCPIKFVRSDRRQANVRILDERENVPESAIDIISELRSSVDEKLSRGGWSKARKYRLEQLMGYAIETLNVLEQYSGKPMDIVIEGVEEARFHEIEVDVSSAAGGADDDVEITADDLSGAAMFAIGGVLRMPTDSDGQWDAVGDDSLSLEPPRLVRQNAFVGSSSHEDMMSHQFDRMVERENAIREIDSIGVLDETLQRLDLPQGSVAGFIVAVLRYAERRGNRALIEYLHRLLESMPPPSPPSEPPAWDDIYSSSPLRGATSQDVTPDDFLLTPEPSSEPRVVPAPGAAGASGMMVAYAPEEVSIEYDSDDPLLHANVFGEEAAPDLEEPEVDPEEEAEIEAAPGLEEPEEVDYSVAFRF